MCKGLIANQSVRLLSMSKRKRPDLEIQALKQAVTATKLLKAMLTENQLHSYLLILVANNESI